MCISLFILYLWTPSPSPATLTWVGKERWLDEFTCWDIKTSKKGSFPPFTSQCCSSFVFLTGVKAPNKEKSASLHQLGTGGPAFPLSNIVLQLFNHSTHHFDHIKGCIQGVMLLFNSSEGHLWAGHWTLHLLSANLRNHSRAVRWFNCCSTLSLCCWILHVTSVSVLYVFMYSMYVRESWLGMSVCTDVLYNDMHIICVLMYSLLSINTNRTLQLKLGKKWTYWHQFTGRYQTSAGLKAFSVNNVGSPLSSLNNRNLHSRDVTLI